MSKGPAGESHELIFEDHKVEEGGYLAHAIGESILVEADDEKGLERKIRDAIECHFGREIPSGYIPPASARRRRSGLNRPASDLAAYGWPVDLTDEQILERLLAMNLERAAGEASTRK